MVDHHAVAIVQLTFGSETQQKVAIDPEVRWPPWRV
jgi:hypothetical protein